MPPKKRARVVKKTWQEIARKAQDHRDASLNSQLNGADEALEDLERAKLSSSNAIKNTHNLPKLVSAEVLQITYTHPDHLSIMLSHGGIKAVDVMRAFTHMAAVAQKSVNCLTELLSSRAMVRAAELDKHYATTGRAVGPLHGIPLSVKSHIGIQGCQVAAGYVSWWNSREHLASEDALVVQILERAGAVVHARTTEPQSMMQLECVSNLFGTTVNPYNTDLSSGGSSGGEAALLAMRGSALGIGSDVGGSIRVPAAACGLYGLKPTAFRVPTTGWSSTPPGADPIPTVIGPMSISIFGIEDFMRVVLAAESWKVEPALLPLPWTDVKIEPTPERPLRIGVCPHDGGLILPHPPILRALEELDEKMGALPGVEIVPFHPYKFDEAWAIASSLYFTDGGAADRKVMDESGEPMLPLVSWMMNENPGVKDLTREELEYWLEERESYRLEYAKHWNQTGRWDEAAGKWVDTVDALICPVAPWIAPRHNTAKYWTYSAVWNLLDYPALAFPAGKADKNLDLETRSSFLGPRDKENAELYDPEVFHGMPVGLQIVGRRCEDEKIVAILKYLRSQGCLPAEPQIYKPEEGA
ncbi:amidase signature domain-containing protein [Cercophora newfieldiana]|uniref:amidase n=1 Tax=Cercophora newfieldiana TaxID=92897 RepID=A0AA39XWC6_9PEZI|nr:amidase signature domain-containing protein [Cercophora newfieldiana]